jgi:sigma-B regulation protein RsbU (phosphoserine phosphatase)
MELIRSIEMPEPATSDQEFAPPRSVAARAVRPRPDAPPWPVVAGMQHVLPRLPGLPRIEVLEEQLLAVDRELDGLRGEVELLRKRDKTLNFYMRRIDEELRLAARLQQDFLPKALPEIGPVRFHALWRPAGYVSGDLYDVIRLDERHVGFYIADAVGHGMPAALLTMFIKNALVTKEIGNGTYRLLEPGEALAKLNDSLVAEQLSTGTFCTACYGVLNTETLELRIASAGHPAPMLLRGDEPAGVVRTEGALLGIFEDERFRTTTHQLRAGDRLVLYTDGIEVAFPDAPDAEDERWKDELTSRRHLGGQELIDDLARHLDVECGSLDPRDDLTLLVVEVK